MSKNKKRRNKSRNRKSAAKVEPSLSALDNVTTTSTGSLLPSRYESDSFNIQQSNVSDITSAGIQSSIDPSDKKRKDLHAMTSANDLLMINRKRNKRRRTTPESLQDQNDSKSMNDNAGKNEGDRVFR